jgi:hypothetical protein
MMGVDSGKWKRDILDEMIVLGYPGVYLFLLLELYDRFGMRHNRAAGNLEQTMQLDARQKS